MADNSEVKPGEVLYAVNWHGCFTDVIVAVDKALTADEQVQSALLKFGRVANPDAPLIHVSVPQQQWHKAWEQTLGIITVGKFRGRAYVSPVKIHR